MTATRPRPLPITSAALQRAPLTPANRSGISAADADNRRVLLEQASQLFEQARLSAEAGEISAAAQAILRGLHCERRAGGLGPQVLQLIKPR